MKTIGSFTGLITLFLFLFLNILPGSALAIPKAPEPDRAGKARIVENYGKLPLSFEKNQGQTDEKVGFLSRGSGYTLFLTPDEAVFALSSPSEDEGLDEKQKDASQVSRPEKQESAKSAVIRMKFSGANTAPVISGQERLQETSNYFIGNDPSKWRTRISKYAKVRYREVYPGIDLVFYGNQRRLEYDFVVSPGSDPSKIRLEFQGAEKISLDEKGNLVLRLKDGEVIQQAPVIYQKVDGRRVNVAGGYWIDNKGRVGCRVASWDRQRPLVIDPVLVYSTYLGGSDLDYGLDIAIDGLGNAYVTGETRSPDFPTVNALYPNLWGDVDAFIFKLSADGSHAVYSTYLGGSSGDSGYGIAVDSSGNAYVTGWTHSSDFPTVNALYPDLRGGQDAFIFKLGADGSHAVYSTYLGGNNGDIGYAIAVDGSGNAYVTGQTTSPDFPTVNALYPNLGGYVDAFIFKLSADGSQAVYSTYLGGSYDDRGYGIAVDGSGNAYVTGYTRSSDFPTVKALYPDLWGSGDAFIFKINADGNQAVYSTYLGGSNYDQGDSIAVDGSGNAYVTGCTKSSNFPTVNALYPIHGGGWYAFDAFIFKLSADGSQAVYSTYLGGAHNDYGSGIAVDGSGNAYVTGETSSPDFPTVNALYPDLWGSGDAFIFKLSADGSQAVYSTYLGGSRSDFGNGIAVDGSGNAYVTGWTSSSDFPTVNALYPNLWGSCDAFIAKISDAVSPVPDIKANGVDEFLTISSTENIKITISLTSGDREGILSDCWISADTPFGLYWYILESQDWIQSDTPILAAQIPLIDVIEFPVFDSTLTDGHYVFNFAVDDNADGLFDKTWSDSVELYVVPYECHLEPVNDEPLGNRTPLILVHGNKSETKYPYRWGDFIERAGQDSDFADSYKMYLFRWDSSLSNNLNGLALGGSIDNEKDLNNREVVILAHSRGGIVSRYYMNDYVILNGGFSGQPGGEHVKCLVTLATPHRGSPGADPVWSIFSFDYNHWDYLAYDLSVAYLLMWDASYLYLLWDDVDAELTDDEVCWKPAILYNLRFCHKLYSVDTDLLNLNSNQSYFQKIIAYGGNEFDGELSESEHEEFISRIQEERKIEIFYDHWGLSYFSGLMAEMPVIPNGYPDNPIDDTYRRFQANDGMVPLDSALLLKPGSGDLFHVEDGNLVFDEDELRNHCQVEECNIIENRQTDHLDFLDDDQVIDIILNRLKIL